MVKLLPQFATATEPLSHRMAMFKKALGNVTAESSDIQYEIFRVLLLIYRDDKHRYFIWPILGKVFTREVDIINYWMATGIPEEYPYGPGELGVVAEMIENDWWENRMILEKNRTNEFDEIMDYIAECEVSNGSD